MPSIEVAFILHKMKHLDLVLVKTVVYMLTNFTFNVVAVLNVIINCISLHVQLYCARLSVLTVSFLFRCGADIHRISRSHIHSTGFTAMGNTVLFNVHHSRTRYNSELVLMHLLHLKLKKYRNKSSTFVYIVE